MAAKASAASHTPSCRSSWTRASPMLVGRCSRTRSASRLPTTEGCPVSITRSSTVSVDQRSRRFRVAAPDRFGGRLHGVAVEPELLAYLRRGVEQRPDHLGPVSLHRLLGERDARVQRDVDRAHRAGPADDGGVAKRRHAGHERTVGPLGREPVEPRPARSHEHRQRRAAGRIGDGDVGGRVTRRRCPGGNGPGDVEELTHTVDRSGGLAGRTARATSGPQHRPRARLGRR